MNRQEEITNKTFKKAFKNKPFREKTVASERIIFYKMVC